MIKKIIKSNKKIYNFLFPVYIKLKSIRNWKIIKKHYYEIVYKISDFVNCKKIFYIGVPVHKNLGDLAQYICIKNWLAEYYPEYKVVEIVDSVVLSNYKNFRNYLKKIIKKDDIFVFQSGYRTTDIANYEGEYTHRILLKRFKNKFIVFPQTINFSSEKEANKSSRAYKKNNNYTFLARDLISYEYAKKIYNKNKVLLYPDIVTTMIGNYPLKKCNKNGILLCLRNDGEKLYTKEQYNEVICKLKNITDKIDITDTNSNLDFEFDKSSVENELRNKIDQFSKYKLIITDRYHGTIFSLISNTFVIVLNSTDHKLSSGVDWFKGVYDDSLLYCNSLEDLYSIASKVYNNIEKSNKSFFKENYYDILIEKINRSE